MSRRAKSGTGPGPSLVIVGNGIASVRFCEAALALKLNERFTITVLGGEGQAAYDRVRLSDFVKTRSAGPLTFHPEEWYADHGIRLRLGDPVASIDRGACRVRTRAGLDFEYERLVLATGSSAFVPPIPGAELPRVHVYRTIDDLEGIIHSAERAGSAAVIGGGLLGLEAAQALDGLGVATTILERAAFPMPRQLNAKAGLLVRQKLEDLGIGFREGFATREIREANGSLELVPEQGEVLRVGMVVISAGIVPNTEFAADSGLDCGVRGGVVVDDLLVSSDPAIHAIGECALHRGEIYGLAAPAAAMAKHLAANLSGRRRPFPRPDLSTRLKMLGVEMTAIGAPLDRGTVLEFETHDTYRLVTLDARRVPVGALAVGPWPESSLVHGWYLDRRALRSKEVERFLEDGVFDHAAAGASVTAWPAERLVCNCAQVSKGTICRAMAGGCRTVESLAAETGASTVCGSCRPLLAELCGSPVRALRGLSPTLLIGVSTAALAVLTMVFWLEIPRAESVMDPLYRADRFWSDPLSKQVTGFSLLGVSLFGLLISLRKRFPKFRLGNFSRWRVFHAAFGLAALGALFAHTGFRFGANLNAWLMAVFVGLNLLGALTGIAAGLETRGGARASGVARRIRPGLTVAHYVLFWPLPVLVTFHVLASYLY